MIARSRWVRAAHRLVIARRQRTLHPGDNPPDLLIAVNLLDADVVHTTNGRRFERFAPTTILRTGQSPAESDTSLR
jgi:hypothetical protein